MEASLRGKDPVGLADASSPALDEDENESPGTGTPRRICSRFCWGRPGHGRLVVAVSLGYSIISILLGVAGLRLTVAGILLSRPEAASSDSRAPKRKNNRR